MRNLRVGDWVEVLSKEEILSTLDKNGRMEGLPFMPQMFQYCGQRFQVYKSAHKTCDFVYTRSSRWLPHGIHLNLRCNGEPYGGCQHDCLIYWKDAWLKKVNDDNNDTDFIPITIRNNNCTEMDVINGTHAINDKNETIYTCQGTEIPDFTKPLPWWNYRQYLEDYTSGNVGIDRLVNGFIYGIFSSLSNAGIKLGQPLRWLYDAFSFIWGSCPKKPGKIPIGQPTPTCELNLQPGELVKVKSHDEILTTLNKEGKNRGLLFDAEMVPYCGKVFRVKSRVTTFLDEKSRKLVIVKNPCIVLEDVICQSRYSRCKMLCPRSIYSWWREIWLERIPDNFNSPSNTDVLGQKAP
jgi:hypothetical protein